MIHCATVFHSCLCSFPSNVFHLKINALFDVAFRFNIGNASHSTRSRGCVATAALYCGQIQENRFRKVEVYLDMKVNRVLIYWRFLCLDFKIICDVGFFIVAPTLSCCCAYTRNLLHKEVAF